MTGIAVSFDELMRLRAEARRLALAAPEGTASLASDVYRSLYRGRGLEFEEVRAYQPGDDVRSIDWRVTARTGRPHTKVFREEREHALFLAVDIGASMRFGSRDAFKMVAAARAAAVLAWLAVESGDRVGGIAFGGGTACRETRPRSGRAGALRFFRLLERAAQAPAEEGDGGAGLAQALGCLRRQAHPGSLIVVLGDFAGIGPEAEGHLAQLAPHHDVSAVFVHDPMEAELPPPGRYVFADAAGRLAVDCRDPGLREAFSERFAARRAAVEGLCRRHRLRFATLATGQDTARQLRTGLLRRRTNAGG